eukprot:NODE_403_length_8041_cov_0.563712.p4 type:complete len:370 gc:universal NODE_403_length_8041_cov_0.563712:5569-6678(+)
MTRSIEANQSTASVELGNELLHNYTAATKQKVKQHQKNRIEKYKKADDKLTSSEYSKKIKYKKRRRLNPKVMMDVNQLPEYADILQTKWNNSNFEEIDQSFQSVENDFEFTLDHLKTSLGRLPVGKTCGGDEIDSYMLRNASDRMQIWILKFINSCLKIGILPQMLKSSDLIPIHKNFTGDIRTENRYISLNSHLRKLIKKMIEATNKHLFDSSESQYGYSKNRSCSDAVYDINQKIMDLKSKNIKYKLIKADCKGAFDNVSRVCIRQVIEKLECPSLMKRLLWTLSATQFTRLRLGGATSEYFATNQGICQGGVLSPKLFALVMDQLFASFDQNIGHYYLFADDILVIQIIGCEEDNELDVLGYVIHY